MVRRAGGAARRWTAVSLMGGLVGAAACEFHRGQSDIKLSHSNRLWRNRPAFYVSKEPTASSQIALRFSLSVSVLNKTSLSAPIYIFQITSRNAAYSSTILSVTWPTKTPTVRSSSRYNLSLATLERKSRSHPRRKSSCNFRAVVCANNSWAVSGRCCCSGRVTVILCEWILSNHVLRGEQIGSEQRKMMSSQACLSSWSMPWNDSQLRTRLRGVSTCMLSISQVSISPRHPKWCK
jgi:hypothetical protein